MLLMTPKTYTKTKTHLPNSISFSMCWTLKLYLPQGTVAGLHVLHSSYTHLLVLATGPTLIKNPELHFF